MQRTHSSGDCAINVNESACDIMSRLFPYICIQIEYKMCDLMPCTRFIFNNITYISRRVWWKKKMNTFRCGRFLATHTVKWKHNLVHSNSQITSNYELIWYGIPNANKSSNYGYQQDESTERWHLKSPWSLSDSSLHLILVRKRSRSWSWMTPIVHCQLALLFLR